MMQKTPEQISYNMSRVKNKDSKIELMLRKEDLGIIRTVAIYRENLI
jgi:G:T-mismatch repair DNA endonuclease (very short patch repair protein)